MRLYIYLNKEVIKCIAASMKNISFDIDFFEYSEKRGYTTNGNTWIRPEIENEIRRREDQKDCSNETKICVSKEHGILCNLEYQKRYINIEDVSSIKNNCFYYNILESIPLDDRVKKTTGIISKFTEKNFFIGKNKYLIDKDIYMDLYDIYENICEITVIGYKMNCQSSDIDIFKVISIYIE